MLIRRCIYCFFWNRNKRTKSSTKIVSLTIFCWCPSDYSLNLLQFVSTLHDVTNAFGNRVRTYSCHERTYSCCPEFYCNVFSAIFTVFLSGKCIASILFSVILLRIFILSRDLHNSVFQICIENIGSGRLQIMCQSL